MPPSSPKFEISTAGAYSNIYGSCYSMKMNYEFLILGIVLIIFLFSWSPVKDGLCPRASPYGPCVVTCGADEDCDGSQKCCSNGCGAWCLEPSKN